MLETVLVVEGVAGGIRRLQRWQVQPLQHKVEQSRAGTEVGTSQGMQETTRVQRTKRHDIDQLLSLFLSLPAHHNQRPLCMMRRFCSRDKLFRTFTFGVLGFQTAPGGPRISSERERRRGTRREGCCRRNQQRLPLLASLAACLASSAIHISERKDQTDPVGKARSTVVQHFSCHRRCACTYAFAADRCREGHSCKLQPAKDCGGIVICPAQMISHCRAGQ